MDRAARSVFVTGGAGFIGGLIRRGYHVRLLARHMPEGLDPSVTVVLGDLTQPESFAASLAGVSSVVHAALIDRPPHDVEVTARLYELSAAAGVRQFIHLSTIAVYGDPADHTITEETPPIPSGDAYCSTKLAIEEALRANPGCPELAILRLGCVYGPGGGWWTQGLLNMMARGKLILVNGGTGYANLIHVEDVGAIIRLLLERSNPPFEIYNVTDGHPVAWSRYFSEIEKIFGQAATVAMTAGEAREYGSKWLRPSLLRRAMRKFTPGATVYPSDDAAIHRYASRAVYSNEKACRMLGFRPDYDFERGIQSVRSERGLSAREAADAMLART